MKSNKNVWIIIHILFEWDSQREGRYTKKSLSQVFFWLIFISARMNFTFTSPMFYHINSLHFLAVLQYTWFDCIVMLMFENVLDAFAQVYFCVFLFGYICLYAYVCVCSFSVHVPYLFYPICPNQHGEKRFIIIFIFCVQVRHRNMINNHNNYNNTQILLADQHTYV